MGAKGQEGGGKAKDLPLKRTIEENIQNYTYIYAEKKDWLNSDLRRSERRFIDAYTQAKIDFHKSFSNQKIDKLIFQKIYKLLKNKMKLEEAEAEIISTLESITKGANAVYNQSIGDITNLRQMVFKGGDEKLRKYLQSICNDGKKIGEFHESISAILTFLNEQAVLIEKKLESLDAEIVSLDEVAGWSNGYKKVEQVVQQTKGAKSLEDIDGIVSGLKSAGGTFISNINGAIHEICTVAVTQGILGADDSLEILRKAVPSSSEVRVNVSPAGTGTYKYKSSVTGRFETATNKGDTRIVTEWKISPTKGYTKVHLISEKSSPIKAHSVNAKSSNFRHGLVGDAPYHTIFDRVGYEIQMLFWNFYIHETLRKDSLIMRYIGARAASNIISGVQGEGQAYFLREGFNIKPIADFFKNIDSQYKKGNDISKYITLKVKGPQINNDKVEGKNINLAANKRVQSAYQQIRDGVTFSATFGSRRGF